MSVLLTIELLISTQKNLYEIAMKNSEEIKHLTQMFNSNMINVRNTLNQLVKNQNKLKQQSDYILNSIIKSRGNKISFEQEENIRRQKMEIETLLHLNEVERNGDINSLRRPRINIARKNRILRLCEGLDEMACEHRRSQKFGLFNKDYQRYDEWEDISDLEIELVKIHEESLLLEKLDQMIQEDKFIVFHTKTKDLFEDNEEVFFNDPKIRKLEDILSS